MVCLQDVVLVAQQPDNPAPAESFDFKTDMDLSGRGQVAASCGTPGLSRPFSVLCVQQAAFVFPCNTRNSLWSYLALLNPSH